MNKELVLEGDTQAKAWLTANLDLEWFSARQLRRIIERLCDVIPNVKDHLSFIRFRILEKSRGFIEKEADAQTKAVFEALCDENRVAFFLKELDCTFEIPTLIERGAGRSLRHYDDAAVQKSLFAETIDEDNEYEKQIALYLDRN